MTIFIFYLFALLATCLYIVRYGGRTGRSVALLQLAMAIVSAGVSYTVPDFATLQPRMLAVDTVSLVLKSAIAFGSTRRWPIWVAAFQLNTVLAATAIMLSPAFRNEFYYAMTTIWAMPALFVMVLGTTLDRWHDARSHDA